MKERDTLYQPFKKKFLHILENNYKLSFDVSVINIEEPLSLKGTIYLNNNKFIEFNALNFRKDINYTYGSKTALMLLLDKVIEHNFKNNDDVDKRTTKGLLDWLWMSVYERHISSLEDFILLVFEPDEIAHQLNILPEGINAIGKKLQVVEMSKNSESILKITIDELEGLNVPYYQIVNKYWNKL